MTAFDSKYYMNLIWDRWDEGLTQIYNGQKQVENLFLQTFNQQKNAWELFFKIVESYTKEFKSEIEKYQAKAYTTVEKYQKDEASQESMQNIQKQLEDVLERITKISQTPQNALKQWISQNLSQIEKNFEDLIQQQEKNRSEIKIMINEMSQEMKDILEKIMEDFEKFQSQNFSLLK